MNERGVAMTAYTAAGRTAQQHTPGFADYQAAPSRLIPLFEISPV